MRLAIGITNSHGRDVGCRRIWISPVVGDCVVADAVPIETVSDLNSLISGKIQGISRILAPNLDCDPQNKMRNQVLERQIPYAIEQGIFCWNREEKSFEQGVCIGELLA